MRLTSRRRPRIRRYLLPLVSALLFGGCGGEDGGGGGDSGASAGVGDKCSSTSSCRNGLECKSDKCSPAGTLALNQRCVISAECRDNLQCINTRCSPAGEGVDGSECSTDGDCAHGYRCGLVGFGAECVTEGTADLGDSCGNSSDCFGGLVCEDAACAQPEPGTPPFGLPSFPGVTCSLPSEGTVRAYFEVPDVEPKGDVGDFFRLPFPNDARNLNGKLDLDSFPTPGTEFLGFDPVQIYVDALEAGSGGFGTDPTVIFRFSGKIDFESFQQTPNDSPINWIDITDPADGKTAGLSWNASDGRTAYLCDNWFAARRPAGSPLEPGHTYAVYLTTDGRDKSGSKIQRSPHLEAVLDADAPADKQLAKVHAAYGKFREYLLNESIPSTKVLNATVFTVADTRSPMQELADTIESEPTPSVKSWVKCGGSAKSPCADENDETRACSASSDDYDEYHALVSLPIFQKGTQPYFESGGDIDASKPTRQEDVCMALTVPKGAMPSEGWPLAVFAHGTGGSFVSHVRAEVAGALATSSTPMAVLGIDQVQHGPRRGDSELSPQTLFFNFANPQAALGNPLQGAADQLSLAKLAATLNADASETGGDAIMVNPDAVVFFGHSQGATHGSLAVPFSSTYRAAVMSGNGASLARALLAKNKPVNISAAVPFVLGDVDPKSGKLASGLNHPVLTILQQFIDPADPLNFARSTAHTPLMGRTATHVFQTYGIDDSYSPAETLEVYALAAKMGLVKADASVETPDAIGKLKEEAAPISGNLSVEGNPVTAAVRQYQSDADGHFVVFDVPSANSDVVRFLAQAAAGDVPEVGN